MPEADTGHCIKDSVFIDPACGTGGMLIEAIRHMNYDNKAYGRIYGQEKNLATSAIARMNLYLHGCQDFKITQKDFFFKFNVEGLLRGDYASRMAGYATARQNGWMSANDIRQLEDLDLIPPELGGDLYLVNGNMVPLTDAGAAYVE